jgi:hypothetical protein
VNLAYSLARPAGAATTRASGATSRFDVPARQGSGSAERSH